MNASALPKPAALIAWSPHSGRHLHARMVSTVRYQVPGPHPQTTGGQGRDRGPGTGQRFAGMVRAAAAQLGAHHAVAAPHRGGARLGRRRIAIPEPPYVADRHPAGLVRFESAAAPALQAAAVALIQPVAPLLGCTAPLDVASSEPTRTAAQPVTMPSEAADAMPVHLECRSARRNAAAQLAERRPCQMSR